LISLNDQELKRTLEFERELEMKFGGGGSIGDDIIGGGGNNSQKVGFVLTLLLLFRFY
jgi:translation initiation factor 1 (eIF-1/SUI1)